MSKRILIRIFFAIDIYGQTNGASSNGSINNGYGNGNQATSQYGQPQTAPPAAPPPPPFNNTGEFGFGVQPTVFVYHLYDACP